MSLHQAVRDGNLEQVRELIATGSEVNAADPSRRTPLHLAVWTGNVDIIKQLLLANANVMAKAQDYFLPLHFAVQKPLSSEVIKLLVKKDKSSLHATIAKGNKTALHIAASKGQLEHVKTLIELGADLTAKTTQGLTAQELASSHDIADYLRSQHVSLLSRNAPNPDGSNSRKRRALAQQGSEKGNVEEDADADPEADESTDHVVSAPTGPNEWPHTTDTASAVSERAEGASVPADSVIEQVPSNISKKLKVESRSKPAVVIDYADQE